MEDSNAYTSETNNLQIHEKQAGLFRKPNRRQTCESQQKWYKEISCYFFSLNKQTCITEMTKKKKNLSKRAFLTNRKFT